VKRRLHELMEDPSAIFAAMRELAVDAAEQKQLLARAAEYAASWTELPVQELRGLLLATVPRIEVLKERIEMLLDLAALRRWIDMPRESRDRQISCDAADRANGRDPGAQVVRVVIPARLKRTGKEMRFVIDGDTDGQVDASLTRLLVRAHAIRDRLLRDGSLSVDEIARQEGLGPSYVTRLLRLTFLAPDIVSRILAGRHPPELSARKLMADTRLPLIWDEQRSLLGFA
jgi:site-specific DNA recombinase